MSDKRTIPIGLPEEDIALLDQAQRIFGVNRSEVLRRAIHAGLIHLIQEHIKLQRLMEEANGAAKKH